MQGDDARHGTAAVDYMKEFRFGMTIYVSDINDDSIEETVSAMTQMYPPKCDFDSVRSWSVYIGTLMIRPKSFPSRRKVHFLYNESVANGEAVPRHANGLFVRDQDQDLAFRVTCDTVNLLHKKHQVRRIRPNHDAQSTIEVKSVSMLIHLKLRPGWVDNVILSLDSFYCALRTTSSIVFVFMQNLTPQAWYDTG
eukprot:scaffold2353_cov167-Amphora_coffeaeformis.AAC.57